jgi:hypothetical protein
VRAAVWAQRSAASRRGLVQRGFHVFTRVVPPHLRDTISAACLDTAGSASAQGCLRKDFQSRHAVAGTALGLIGDLLQHMGAPASAVSAILTRTRGGQLHMENLTCVRALAGFKASTQQPLHTDLSPSAVAVMDLPGGVTTGAALSLLLPAATASAASYVPRSHQYNLGGVRLAAARPVLVEAGDLLACSPMVAHFGGAGALLPPPLSHRPALFVCAHQAGAGPQAPATSIHSGGRVVPLVSFGEAGYNNCATGTRGKGTG